MSDGGNYIKTRTAATSTSSRIGLFFATARVSHKRQRPGHLEIGSDQTLFIKGTPGRDRFFAKETLSRTIPSFEGQTFSRNTDHTFFNHSELSAKPFILHPVPICPCISMLVLILCNNEIPSDPESQTSQDNAADSGSEGCLSMAVTQAFGIIAEGTDPKLETR
jgi:hypothetical protein